MNPDGKLLCLDLTESDPKYSNMYLQTIQSFPLYSTTPVICPF